MVKNSSCDKELQNLSLSSISSRMDDRNKCLVETQMSSPNNSLLWTVQSAWSYSPPLIERRRHKLSYTMHLMDMLIIPENAYPKGIYNIIVNII